MKKALVSLAAALCATHAMAGDFYVGGAAGTSHYRMDSDWMSIENGKVRSAKIVGGYQFAPSFGLEMGYARLGEATAYTDPLTMRFRTDTLYVALTGSVPVSPAVSLFGKVGSQGSVTRVRYTVYGDSYADESNIGSPMLGAGFKLALGNTVTLVAEYEHFGLVAESDDAEEITADMASVGLHFSF